MLLITYIGARHTFVFPLVTKSHLILVVFGLKKRVFIQYCVCMLCLGNGQRDQIQSLKLLVVSNKCLMK